MKAAFIIVLGITVAVIMLFFILAMVSRSGEPPGLAGGMLSKCPDRPNCVCSEYVEDTAHHIPPIPIPPDNQQNILPLLTSIIGEMGGTVLAERDGYLAATFSSVVFGFVDDLEVRIDTARQLIHIRSGSRVGYSDGGVNAKRTEQLRTLFEAKRTAS
ncbi:DUF1499 domain-containing protein [Sedimenticola selenatireducens]|uniref:DUF1499 domain-containing protein n=1 Tax=Sedimenticola selenatireducens TaxID=191960 RepID=A0A2N6D1F9_9GAMM|nr:DUF1499 domain-containing protein [Sedimenticola selenatireducens]PLX63534.1 MAG: DUF1499 domain-containing protein [Sedimenticola selenatireducens]